MQDKVLLHGSFQKWNVTKNDCFMSCGRIKPTFHCMVTRILKTVVSEWHETLVSTTVRHCILLKLLFGVILLRLFFWGLSFLKNLILYPTGKPVLSLLNGILHFCVTTLCLHCRKDMHYLLPPSCTTMLHPTLHLTSRRSCCNLSPKTTW